MIEKLISPFIANKKNILTGIIPYLLFGLLITRILELYRLCGSDIIIFTENIKYIYMTFPRWNREELLYGLLAAIFLKFYIYSRSLDKKTFRPGEEYGSARWGTPEDIEPYIDKDFSNNMIFSQTEFLTMNPKMEDFELNRNKNVLGVGGSGTGKTYKLVKPALMQAYASYVVTDPKGTLLPQTGHLFEKLGYNIKVIDVKDFANSMHYNPFAYLKKEEDVLTLANVLYQNLKGELAGPPLDPTWDNGAILCLSAFISYIWREAPVEEQNISTVMEMFLACEIREDDENFKNAIDLLFEDLEKEQPNHFSVRQWKTFQIAAGKTAKSILITLGAMMSPLNMDKVRNLMAYDDLQFDTFGDPEQKTILYCIMSDTDKTFNFILAILFTQMFNVLCNVADIQYGGEMPTPIQFIIDEFANIGKIPQWEILIATIRSRLISAMMFVQTKSQLKAIYKDHAETIIGNCDTTIFLGGKEKTTLKDLEESLGEQTIDLFNESETYSQTRSSGRNFNKVARKLKSVFELNVMPRNKCIVEISGLPPFYSDKYDTKSHPRYKYLSDYDKKNKFDWKEYERKRIQKEMAFEPGSLKMYKNDVYTTVRMGDVS